MYLREVQNLLFKMDDSLLPKWASLGPESTIGTTKAECIWYMYSACVPLYSPTLNQIHSHTYTTTKIPCFLGSYEYEQERYSLLPLTHVGLFPPVAIHRATQGTPLPSFPDLHVSPTILQHSWNKDSCCCCCNSSSIGRQTQYICIILSLFIKKAGSETMARNTNVFLSPGVQLLQLPVIDG